VVNTCSVIDFISPFVVIHNIPSLWLRKAGDCFSVENAVSCIKRCDLHFVLKEKAECADLAGVYSEDLRTLSCKNAMPKPVPSLTVWLLVATSSWHQISTEHFEEYPYGE
jgi:hypothetical protein